jgi:hypothetical protein
MNRRGGEAARRYQERRRREDEAPRLVEQVPELDSLKLDFSERRAGMTAPEVSHIRRVVVANAPALFEVPCTDGGCEDGGHDLTHAILRELRSKSTAFEGEDACHGHVGGASCGRTLHYVAAATYRS